MNNVLYFPYIFPSEKWIKISSLCWDKIYTLGSEKSSTLPYNLSLLNESLGTIIHTIDVAKIFEREEIFYNFQFWVESNIDSLDKNFAKVGNSDEEMVWFALLAEKWAIASKTHKLLDLLESLSLLRVEGTLKGTKTLVDKKFIKKHRLPDEHKLGTMMRLWYLGALENPFEIYLPKNIALYYLSLAANVAVKEYNADLCADSDIYADSALFSLSRTRGEVTKSIVEAFLPENIDLLPIEKLRELREELSTQRLRYQTAIHNLCEEFAKVTTEEGLDKKKKEIIDIGKQRIDEVRQTYRRAHLTIIATSLGLTLIPGSISSISSLLGIGIFAPATVIAGIAGIAASFFLQRENAQANFNSNSWSYVLNLKKLMKE